MTDRPTDFSDLPSFKPARSSVFSARKFALMASVVLGVGAAAYGLTPERGFRIGYEQTYEWFRGTALVDAPDVLSDPVWGAGYDFALEAEVAAAVRARG